MAATGSRLGIVGRVGGLETGVMGRSGAAVAAGVGEELVDLGQERTAREGANTARPASWDNASLNMQGKAREADPGPSFLRAALRTKNLDWKRQGLWGIRMLSMRCRGALPRVTQAAATVSDATAIVVLAACHHVRTPPQCSTLMRRIQSLDLAAILLLLLPLPLAASPG